jgi:hypothetical protein
MGHRVCSTVVGGAGTPFRWEAGDIGPNHLPAESPPVLGKRTQVEVDTGAYQRVVIMAEEVAAREVVA